MIEAIIQLLGTPSFLFAIASAVVGSVVIVVLALVAIYVVVRVVRAAWHG